MNQDGPNNADLPPAAGDLPAPGTVAADVDAGATSRRRLLMLGAISASAVVTIRPALAQTAGSVLNCEIPVPDPRAGQWISAEGKLVAPGKPGAFPPAPRPLTGEEVRSALNLRTPYRGMDYDASQAYTKYIRRLQLGNSGFTCYASLQMPRG
jgi:hypothetical protein